MLKILVITVVMFYALAVCVMYVAQRRFIYFPDPVRTKPAAAGLPTVSEETIATPDGEKLVAWYAPAKPGNPTLLYFHGNGGALELRNVRIRKYLARGRGIFIMAYRGYSGSTGAPSERANVADAKLAYEVLRKKGIWPEDIILYGESLGTGVAVQVASEKAVGGVILDSPFTSVAERAQQLFPWLPVGLLLKDRYDSIRYIGAVHEPLLIVHGEADAVVPVEMGRRLFEAANEPKHIDTLPGAGHENHSEFGSHALINKWIDDLRAEQRRLRTGAR